MRRRATSPPSCAGTSRTSSRLLSVSCRIASHPDALLKLMYDAGEMPLDVVSPRTTSFGFVRTCGALLLLASVAGCASHRSSGGGSSASAQRGMYKVGAPYVIDGVTYTPMEEF